MPADLPCLVALVSRDPSVGAVRCRVPEPPLIQIHRVLVRRGLHRCHQVSADCVRVDAFPLPVDFPVQVAYQPDVGPQLLEELPFSLCAQLDHILHQSVSRVVREAPVAPLHHYAAHQISVVSGPLTVAIPLPLLPEVGLDECLVPHELVPLDHLWFLRRWSLCVLEVGCHTGCLAGQDQHVPSGRLLLFVAVRLHASVQFLHVLDPDFHQLCLLLLSVVFREPPLVQSLSLDSECHHLAALVHSDAQALQVDVLAHHVHLQAASLDDLVVLPGQGQVHAVLRVPPELRAVFHHVDVLQLLGVALHLLLRRALLYLVCLCCSVHLVVVLLPSLVRGGSLQGHP